jgi:IS30 family transposase
MMSYSHITSEQRTELAALLRAGVSNKNIAAQLKKHPTTISREIKRNSEEGDKYDARKAVKIRKLRKANANYQFKKLKISKKGLKKYIIKKVMRYWSPEQISGRLKLRYGRTVICHETIYRFIFSKRPDLEKYLRCRKGKWRLKYGSGNRIKKRKKLEESNKKSIDTRPDIINNRERLGDFEGDTVLGARGEKDRLLTYTDRRSGYELARKIPNGLAETVNEHTIEVFKSVPDDKQNSITNDNGVELSGYEIIENILKIPIYHAHPYSSWERGTNENTNGLLRQFFPKRQPLAKVTQEDLDKVLVLLNHRPRKRLGYLTPHEVFMKNCTLK